MSDAVIGLLLTLLIGLLWSFVGVYYKLMANWKINPFNIGIVTGTLGIVLSLCFITHTGSFLNGELPLPGWKYVVFVLLAGFANSGGCYILQRSMLYGRSGVMWAIGQSALVVPFLAITILYSEPWSFIKLAGTAAILVGMAFFGMKNSQKSGDAPRPRYGLQLALISFLILGLAQTMFSALSFFAYDDPGESRPLLAGAGALLATAFCKIVLKDRGFHFERKLLPVILLLAMQGVIVLLLQFSALDHLRRCGMNGIFFPVAVGLCIGGYALWAVLFFKEKPTRILTAGLCAILTGILCFCIANAIQ